MMRKLATLFVILVSFSVNPVAAQSSVVPDSLYLQLAAMPDDTQKVDLLRNLARNYLGSAPEEGAKFAQEALDLARTMQYKKGMASALNTLGLYHLNRSELVQALGYFEECLAVSQELNFAPGIGGSLTNLGVTYFKMESYERAMSYYLQNLKLQEEAGNKSAMGDIYNNMGGVRQQMGDLEGALEKYQHALSINLETKYFPGMADALNNIGYVLKKNGKFKEAKNAFMRSLSIYDSLGNSIGIARVNTLLGLLSFDLGDYSEAINYFKISSEYYSSIENKEGVGNVMFYLGQTYAKKGDPFKSRDYLQKGLQIAGEIGNKNQIMEVSTELSGVHFQTGDYKNAFLALQTATLIKDSLEKENSKGKIANMGLQFDLDKKIFQDSVAAATQAAIQKEQIEHQEKISYAIGAGLALMILIALLIFRSYRQKQKANVIISREKQRSEDLLLNILPAETAEELKTKGFALPQAYEAVTVLFTDFKGFTMISEMLSPQELVAEIDHCFKAFDRVMEEFHIEKIKTIGDAYMCAGGVPTPGMAGPYEVIQAGIKMRDFMLARKIEREAEGKPAFEIRVGIHTGPVVAGIVGLKKFQYDIWGDAVNIAARMESSGQPGKVNISQVTYELVQGAAETMPGSNGNSGNGKPRLVFESRGKIQAKNKGEMEMYFVEKA